MKHVRLLYALLGLTYFGSTLTGCVSIENYYESPSGTTAESVRYVQTSRASCPCCSRADATNTSRSYYTGQETCSGRCTHSVSSNRSETIYVVVDQNGNYYYPADPADCPPDRRGRNPQVIYLPDQTSTPPVITHTPPYSGRERDRPIEDRVGGSSEGTVTTSRSNGRGEEERPLEYWENDGLDGTVTTNGTGEKEEAKILEDRISGQNDVTISTNDQKREEGKPVKDRVDGSTEGIVTTFEEEELTKVEKSGEEKGINYGRESKVGDGTTGEQSVSQEGKSTVKQEEMSATKGREQRGFGETVPVSTTGNRTDEKVEETKVAEPKRSAPSNLGNGNRYRAETKSSGVVEQQKPASTSSTSPNNQKEQPKQSQQVAKVEETKVAEPKTSAPANLGSGNRYKAETKSAGVVEQQKPASTSSTSPNNQKEQPKQSQQVTTQQTQTSVVQETKPVQSSPSSSSVSVKKEQPKQSQQVATQQAQTSVVQETKPVQSSPSSSSVSVKEEQPKQTEQKVVSPTASTTTSSPQSSTPAESPKQSVGGTFSPQ
ncbi:MAG: hypothetical protein AB7H80_00895 [Candidatus Kapaibacterium sp.]